MKASVLALAACASNSGPPPSPCTDAMVPATVHLAMSGFSRCSCFEGTFALAMQTDAQGPIWVSPPITGCPGQNTMAFLKFSTAPSTFGIGITDQTSDPGSGDSDFAPVTSGTCSPFELRGGRAESGNISVFCPPPAPPEDEAMSWTLTD